MVSGVKGHLGVINFWLSFWKIVIVSTYFEVLPWELDLYFNDCKSMWLQKLARFVVQEPPCVKSLVTLPEWIIWLFWAMMGHYTDKMTQKCVKNESFCLCSDTLWLKWVKWFTRGFQWEEKFNVPCVLLACRKSCKRISSLGQSQV